MLKTLIRDHGDVTCANPDFVKAGSWRLKTGNPREIFTRPSKMPKGTQMQVQEALAS